MSIEEINLIIDIINVAERLLADLQTRYEEANLGEGAYSIVYKVERLADKKIYALKKVKLANLSEK